MTKKLTEEEIENKWEYKLTQITRSKEAEAQRRIEERKVKLHEKTELEIERKTDKIRRKTRAYLNRKRVEYDRKCKNEIRKLQGKEEKVYKVKSLNRNQKLQFALAIAQENARLRDSDENGNANCISCQRRVTWEEFA